VTFVQGPEYYLNQLGITVPCVVDPTREARLEEDYRVFVNWETYYLCDEEALAAFRADPARYAGKVTDPVTRERFRPGPDAPRSDYAGRIFLFSSGETAAAFAAMPDSFATPQVPMAMKPRMGE